MNQWHHSKITKVHIEKDYGKTTWKRQNSNNFVLNVVAILLQGNLPIN